MHARSRTTCPLRWQDRLEAVLGAMSLRGRDPEAPSKRAVAAALSSDLKWAPGDSYTGWRWSNAVLLSCILASALRRAVETLGK